jgi:polyhydroxyalkanoate synthesis regulator phasin
MAEGLIQDKMARPEGDELTPEAVKNGIQIPPDMQEAYDRVVVAGMKLMFSKETHRIMLKEMQKQGPLSQRLGRGVAGLMLIMVKESNNTMPPQIIIPAGIELMMQAVDFMKKTDMANPTNEEIGQAMQIMITTIMEKFGVDPAKFEQMLNQFDNTNVDAAMQQQMGGAA